MATVSASTRHIQALQARGFNYAQIGRATGVNRSLIRQIGRGEKPGRNLTGTLRALSQSQVPAPKRGQSVEGVKLPAPKRKTTAAGTQAAVRQKEQPALRGSSVDRRTARAGMNAIRKAAAAGQNIKITLRFKELKNYKDKAPTKNGQVSLFDKGGQNAQDVLDQLNAMGGSDASKFRQFAEEVLSGQGLEAKGFQGIAVARFDVVRQP